MLLYLELELKYSVQGLRSHCFFKLNLENGNLCKQNYLCIYTI